jgi:hypothetical protein
MLAFFSVSTHVTITTALGGPACITLSAVNATFIILTNCRVCDTELLTLNPYR